jgi:hypothetical protein
LLKAPNSPEVSVLNGLAGFDSIETCIKGDGVRLNRFIVKLMTPDGQRPPGGRIRREYKPWRDFPDQGFLLAPFVWGADEGVY